MTDQFNEDKYRRDKTGKFTEKPHGIPTKPLLSSGEQGEDPPQPPRVSTPAPPPGPLDPRKVPQGSIDPDLLDEYGALIRPLTISETLRSMNHINTVTLRTTIDVASIDHAKPEETLSKVRDKTGGVVLRRKAPEEVGRLLEKGINDDDQVLVEYSGDPRKFVADTFGVNVEDVIGGEHGFPDVDNAFGNPALDTDKGCDGCGNPYAIVHKDGKFLCEDCAS